MELYTKESLKEVIEKSKDEFYMPKALFDHYKSLRLETKLAYVSILETMKIKRVIQLKIQLILKWIIPKFK